MTRTKQALLRKRHGGEAPRKQMAPKAARKSGTPFHRTRPDPVPCSLCAEPGVSLRAGTWVCAKHSRAAETAEWQRREAKRKRAADAAAEAAAAEDAAHDARIDAAEAESSESEGGAILLADGVVHSVARKALRLQHALSHAKPEAVVAHLLAVANGADAAAQHALAKMLPKAAFPAAAPPHECTRCGEEYDPRYAHGCRIEHEFDHDDAFVRQDRWDNEGHWRCARCRECFDGGERGPHEPGLCFEGDHTTEVQSSDEDEEDDDDE